MNGGRSAVRDSEQGQGFGSLAVNRGESSSLWPPARVSSRNEGLDAFGSRFWSVGKTPRCDAVER